MMNRNRHRKAPMSFLLNSINEGACPESLKEGVCLRYMMNVNTWKHIHEDALSDNVFTSVQASATSAESQLLEFTVSA